MKKFKNQLLLTLALTLAGLIGVIRGEAAKQKWVFKMKTKYEGRRLVKERKLIARKGGVLLDDMELEAYHRQ